MKHNTSIINECVRILYGRAIASISTAMAATTIIAYLFREQISPPLLLAWLGFMFTVSFVRYWMVLDYNKNKDKTSDHTKFERHYSFTTGLTGLGWAVFCAIAFSLPTHEYHIYALLLLVSLIALSAPIFSSSIKTMYFYVAPSLVIVIPLLLSHGGDDIALAIALLVFSAMVIRTGRESYHTLIDTLTLRHDTQILRNDTQKQAKKLKQAQYEITKAESRLSDVFKVAPEAIITFDSDLNIILFNDTAENIFGYQQSEVLGKHLNTLLPKSLWKMHAKVVREFENSADSNISMRERPSLVGTRKNGETFPIAASVSKVDTASGKIFIVMVSDITERIRTEESLRISQQRLLLHRDQSPLGIIEWNTDFEVLAWNPAVERIFGYSKEEVMGKHILDKILPESARPEIDDIWQALLANKGGAHSINENITKDGRSILCEWHNTPIVDDERNVIGVSVLIEDITEKQKKEENERHTQKMDALGQLTGGIAHDFNNMLGVILGFSGLLKKNLDENNPKQMKYCDQILRAGDRAKKLTANLLEFSHKTPPSAEAVDINELLSGTQHMLERTLTPRIKLVFEQGKNLWPVWLDKARLEDAILNMSINAMHAMPDGGTLTMNTSTRHFTKGNAGRLEITPGDYVVLSITDTGSGMPPEVQKKIFDPFYTTKGAKGTGLGLSQVHGFVQQAGGNVWVSSKIGQGTKFTLYIPRYLEDEIPKPAESIDDLYELSSGDETILVVDDEESLLTLNEVILTSAGYTVLLANCADQALKILKENNVDLMLCDAIMPRIDGYKLAVDVEKLYPDVKVQMISGYSDENDKTVTNNKLYEDRLHKPITANTLLRRVTEILDKTK